jgi:hypothetical protein
MRRGRRWQGKTAGGVGFALNFLWLLSFFQEKESNNSKQVELPDLDITLFNRMP